MSKNLSGTVPQPRVLSGVHGLDTILQGGFVIGGLYIVQGSPGAGKTILTNQICFHHVATGGRATFVTLLAESHARMINNMREMSFFDDSFIPDRLSYLSAFNEMRDGGLDTLLSVLRREITRNRTTVLVLDGLISAQAAASSEQAFKVFIHGLQEVALATNCTVFLTTNVTAEFSSEQTMVDGIVVLTDRIYGWQAASDLQVLKFRGSAFLRGRHAYKITDAGLLVYPRIEALFAVPSHQTPWSAARLSTGFGKLDSMLGGGLPSASTTMLMGPSGIGKTTLGLQFLSLSTADEPGLLFGFYETPESLRRKAAAINPALLAALDDGNVEIAWQTSVSDLLDAFAMRLLDEVNRRGVKRLFIDGFTALLKGAVDPSRVGDFFSALSAELSGSGVTTVYAFETPNVLAQEVRLPMPDVSSLAENIVLLRFVENVDRMARQVSILKLRDSDFDPRFVSYTLSDSGFSVDRRKEESLGTTGPVEKPAGSTDLRVPGA